MRSELLYLYSRYWLPENIAGDLPAVGWSSSIMHYPKHPSCAYFLASNSINTHVHHSCADAVFMTHHDPSETLSFRGMLSRHASLLSEGLHPSLHHLHHPSSHRHDRAIITQTDMHQSHHNPFPLNTFHMSGPFERPTIRRTCITSIVFFVCP